MTRSAKLEQLWAARAAIIAHRFIIILYIRPAADLILYDGRSIASITECIRSYTGPGPPIDMYTAVYIYPPVYIVYVRRAYVACSTYDTSTGSTPRAAARVSFLCQGW
jgi:hypothetical protein